MGLMDYGPEIGRMISGIGQGLSSAGRGRAGNGFDMGNTASDIYGMMRGRQQEKKIAGLMEQMGGSFSPEQQAYIEAFPRIGAQAMGDRLFPQSSSPSALAERVQMLESSGVERNTAIGIATGRIVTSRDPVTGVATLIDKASGRLVGPMSGGGAAAGPAGGAPVGGAPAAPAGGRPTPVPVEMPGAAPAAAVPESTPKFDTAFGLEGGVKNALNTVSDFLGAGQVFPDEATAVRQIENLNTQVSTLLAQSTETRGGKYLLDRFDKISAKPGGLQGAEDAVKTLREMRDMLDRARQIDESIIGSRVSPTEKSKAQASVLRLSPMIKEYDTIINEFERQYFGTGQPAAAPAGSAPEGVEPHLWDIMTPEERALWDN